MFKENKHIQSKKCNFTKTFYSFHEFHFGFYSLRLCREGWESHLDLIGIGMPIKLDLVILMILIGWVKKKFI